MLNRYTIPYRRANRVYLSDEDFDQVTLRATTLESALEKFHQLLKELRIPAAGLQVGIISSSNINDNVPGTTT